MWSIYLIPIGILLKNLTNLVKVFLSETKRCFFLNLFKIDQQCPLEQVYSKRNKTFVRGLPVEVIKMEAERIYNPVTEFLYPYL
jgi:hypothetical protein